MTLAGLDNSDLYAQASAVGISSSDALSCMSSCSVVPRLCVLLHWPSPCPVPSLVISPDLKVSCIASHQPYSTERPLQLALACKGMREGKKFIQPIPMMLRTREASQGLKQQLSWPTCQPRASICDWPAATYPENTNTKTRFPPFCYTVSFSFVSVSSSARKSPPFLQQSTWKVNNTTFFPALFDSRGDCLAASLGQRGSRRLQ